MLVNFKMPVFIAAIIFLSGCAITEAPSDEETVAKRAQERTDALMQLRYKDAFQYTSPGFRARTDISVYQRMFAGASSWTKGEVRHVTCEESTCKVVLMMTYKLPRIGGETNAPRGETWVKIDGQWWIYHK